MKKVYLASASPRRKALLEQIGVYPEIVISSYQEKHSSTMAPEAIVIKHAIGKVSSCSTQLIKAGALLIGADTIVVLDGNILGKPQNRDDAYFMLKQLSGKTHAVYTGVAVLNQDNDCLLHAWECTEVKMREISEEELQNYLDTNEPYDKAGAYAIQGLAALFIERIQGSYSNVVGLPLCTLTRLLEESGYLVTDQW